MHDASHKRDIDHCNKHMHSGNNTAHVTIPHYHYYYDAEDDDDDDDDESYSNNANGNNNAAAVVSTLHTRHGATGAL